MERTSLDKFTADVAQTRAFKRLNRISFLGIVDREIHRERTEARTYSRAEHSLGVLALAKQVVELARLQREDAYHLLAAALLHDVAHPAFSHSLEYAFARGERDLDHHEALRMILLEENNASRDLHRVLRLAGVFPERLVSIIDGSDKLNYFFSSPFNIDTIDGIRRSFLSVGVFATYNDKLLLQITCDTYSGIIVSDPRLIAAADSFWQYKSIFYEKILSSRIGNSERLFQTLIRSYIDRLHMRYFLMGDDEFRLRHPEVFHALDLVDKNRNIQGLISPTQQFVIDQSVSVLDKKTIFLRYRRKRAAGKDLGSQTARAG